MRATYSRLAANFLPRCLRLVGYLNLSSQKHHRFQPRIKLIFSPNFAIYKDYPPLALDEPPVVIVLT